MYCPECGEDIPDDSVYCPACGADIEDHLSDPQPGQKQAETKETGESGTDDGWNITLGKIVAYPVGLFLILSGLAALIDSIFAAIIWTVGGIISLPITRSKLHASQGVHLSRYATVAIVVIAAVSGSVVYSSGTTGGLPDDPGSNAAETEDLIEKPATELVIQIDQLEVGWSGSLEGNESYAEGRYFNSENDAVLQSIARKYETVDNASNVYNDRVKEVSENVATDSVQLGDEGIVYVRGNTAWVVFRDANVVGEIRYTQEFASDRAGSARDFAELMYENL